MKPTNKLSKVCIPAIILICFSFAGNAQRAKSDSLRLKTEKTVTIKNDNGKQLAEQRQAEQQLAAQLAAEMKNLGVDAGNNIIEALTQAIGKGGQAGMALAQTLVIQFSEIGKGAPASTEPKKKTLNSQQLNTITRVLDSTKYVNLELSQYVRQKLKN